MQNRYQIVADKEATANLSSSWLAKAAQKIEHILDAAEVATAESTRQSRLATNLWLVRGSVNSKTLSLLQNCRMSHAM